MANKVALVTGGSRGIGFGIARHLAADGCSLVINGVREPGTVQGALEELRGHGVEAVYSRGDMGSTADREQVMADTMAAFGRLDVLVNNAGMTSPGRLDILEATEANFDRVMAVNAKGPWFLCQAAAHVMIKQKEADPSFRGVMINVTSMNVTVVTTNRGDYCISKAALAMGTQLWASRLAEFDIDCYEIRPGIIATDMTAPVTDKYTKLIAGGITLNRRWGTPDDIGRAAAALARGDIPYATGQVIVIDGGFTMVRL
jgi:NAD(P)-dependent dehydrogenase (short-subunit alcohol dehydrogenase family)